MEALTGWVDRSNDNSFICSTHFTDDSWEQSSVNRRLKADALPTLFPQGVDVSPVSVELFLYITTLKNYF